MNQAVNTVYVPSHIVKIQIVFHTSISSFKECKAELHIYLIHFMYYLNVFTFAIWKYCWNTNADLNWFEANSTASHITIKMLRILWNVIPSEEIF